jgi:hypothetical protein
MTMNPNLFNPNGAKPYSRQRPFTKKGDAKNYAIIINRPEGSS